ncbi:MULTISPECIES: ABC transporter permease [Burkholderia]|uniref:ABC transporter permease n=1 Tax=Burkholderia TaxID=32008 RepID=UPI00075285DB|nr:MULTISPECIES: ABC transporter permease [Burkholderia]KVW77155.1 sugar ABC transporter permease [Burkholderia cepacia]KVX69265.1 sugar ABC transporter permease [Burkholderia cepacia]KWC89483.1 sugar ABC transporter permease [Burkholderia cepacia]KWD66082.1 sugar ABC transporter permease [Burkholderia cepacia]KWD73515.1 sugar ABC transporter permease [Burkholderia cepacia]
MRNLRTLGIGSTETWLLAVIVAMAIGLGIATPTFLTLSNLFDLLNQSAVNIIFAVGLLIVLIAGGIDISFAVGASVVQYLAALTLMRLGGGNWALGFAVSAGFGILLGAVNATIIYRFRVVSIVATIATFNIFFGGLMFVTGGVSIYDLPDWWTNRVTLVQVDTTGGVASLALPVAVMVAAVVVTWFLLRRTTLGRQLYATGDNPEAARRVGIDLATMHYVAYGWLGMMAGIAGLMQAHYVQEVVPNALYGRELDVLAAVVLGGARLGGGRGTVLGAILGILLVSITANGLNLLGVSPYAFKMIVGAVILVAITVSSDGVARLVGSRFLSPRART